MDVTGFNESDVREEIAAPLLAALGYASGTAADIRRERTFTLVYSHLFLGRKNPGSDPVLRGRPDYVLIVLGVCRWVFEIKAPSEPIDRDAIEQGLSYARHPEISAELVAVLNGREFRLFRTSQLADDEPLIVSTDCSVASLHGLLENVLSPAALRRDFKPRDIDLGRPVGGGLRSREEVVGGTVTSELYDFEIIECPPGFVEQFRNQLESTRSVITGMQSFVESGWLARSEMGSITAGVKWVSPYVQMEPFMQSLGLNDIQYVCIDEIISSDPEKPSAFDYFAAMTMEPGTEVFDMARREITMIGVPGTAESSGQAIGYLDGRTFNGFFQSETLCTFKAGVPVTVMFRIAGNLKIRF